MLIATGEFEGRGTHVLHGTFRIEQEADGKVWLTTSDDFYFDGSPEPGFAISASGNFTPAEAAATDFLRLSGTGSPVGAQIEVQGKQRGEIPEGIDIGAANAVFLWCFQFPSVLGVGVLQHG